LQLRSGAFDNLEPGPAEMLDQLAGGHSVQCAMVMVVRRGGRLFDGRGLWGRCRGAGGKQER
jgi:hypothetical protein